ncbi:glycerol-3-phosphate 1-O-acyltransferase PlsY [Sulfurovum sp.]|jgi:glycerol-3-phosphate acyltransferase PlsY|uniref:glycerol-3-phosphate 1-O-acyltransferase PlsY n=1 Tax=Sulfurovum sp. TaxID=1969726 RepID=UPI002A359AF8|nr:glycerol-3-phosphate 1-O-acyltransferase PlsY [Sulfurovum sp.]MDY0403047.1 glycerol-3-phosphate 1-O-acyltransferase PlsY [Sulfurovum sp.]
MDLLSNQNILLYLAAYLLAGIPFGYLLAKQFAGVDIKQAGSGNIGATNVLRVVKEQDPKLAKKLGAITLFLDAIKGVVVILIAKFLGAPEGVLWTIAVLAVLGHCFSVFLAFEGGKGVATGFGVLLVMMPVPALIAISVWLIAAKGLKISSISSLIGLVAFIIASYLIYPEVPVITSHAPIWIIAIVIFYKHIPNIVRLFKKEEGRV